MQFLEDGVQTVGLFYGRVKKNQQQCNGWTLCLAWEIVNPLLDFEWVLLVP